MKAKKNPNVGRVHHTKVDVANYDAVKKSYKKVSPDSLTPAGRRRLEEIKKREG